MQDSISESEPGNEERRRYFRIDDNVCMDVRRINQRAVDVELDLFNKKRESFCMLNSILHNKEQHLPQQTVLRNKYPEVAAYIGYLEERIDALSKIVMSQEDEAELPICHVNLSAQGIRFFSNKAYQDEDLVEIRLILKPSCARVLLIGTVVWCIEDQQAPTAERYAVAVDFTYIYEADREVLVKHIHNKQLQLFQQQEFGIAAS